MEEEGGNCSTRAKYNQLKLLYEQTSNSLERSQQKLVLTERQLAKAEVRLNSRDERRKEIEKEADALRKSVSELRKTHRILENENTELNNQLDDKTRRIENLERDLKLCMENKTDLEQQAKDLEAQLEKIKYQTLERDSELQETSTENETLRKQLTALKHSRDQAILQNGRLSNDLAEVLTLKKKLIDSELEVGQLKQQLQHYVQEVKKAEEDYARLSQERSLLNDTNQGLAHKNFKYKGQISELETEIRELRCKTDLIKKFENKIVAFKSENDALESILESSVHQQNKLKMDLEAQKNICDKLDIEKEKLEEELQEFNEIRRKLEKDNERLRSEVEELSTGNHVLNDALESLLSKTRKELEDRLVEDSKLSQQLLNLQQENEQLLNFLEMARQWCLQNDKLIIHHVHHVHSCSSDNLTDERFRQTRTHENQSHQNTS